MRKTSSKGIGKKTQDNGEDCVNKKPEAPRELLANAEERTQSFIKDVRKAMTDIELEIGKNDGIYPFNGGRLSAREVCRRAGVSYQTLQGPLHKDTTRQEVNSWVKRVLQDTFRGAKNVRRAVTDRATSWKERHDAIAQNYHKNKLEMIVLRKKIVELEGENEALRKQISLGREGNVIPLPKKPSKKGKPKELPAEP